MKIVKQTRSKTEMLDLGNTMSCMQICKGGSTILVVQSHEVVIVVDRYLTVGGNVPFIKLAKVYNGTDKAYDGWLHVVGKMCKKESKSKYFDKPKLSEHLVNGKFPEYMRSVILDVATTAVRLANENVYCD